MHSSNRAIVAEHSIRMMRVASVLSVLIAGCGDPHMVSGYGSTMGPSGPRARAHTGVDFVADQGDPVLAAADGDVVWTENNRQTGIGILLGHPPNPAGVQRLEYAFYTVYLHLSRAMVQRGTVVTRGEKIGAAGSTGLRSGGRVHLHFQVCSRACETGTRDGDFGGVLDPTPLFAGCFSRTRRYEARALTYPIACD